LTRDDLNRQQKLYSMVESVRQYLGAEFALLSCVEDGAYRASCQSPANARLAVPLSVELSRESARDQQVVIREHAEDWRIYIACPVFIQGALDCVLEFASSRQFEVEQGYKGVQQVSNLTMNILSLVSQWIGTENRLLEEEKQSQEQIQDVQARFEDLSPREHQVLTLLTRGESTKSMARKLGISTKTIEMHRANLLRKTAAKSSTELVQLAVVSGNFHQTQ
jgi:DNA-binding CsgD family transcriptional regulator